MSRRSAPQIDFSSAVIAGAPGSCGELVQGVLDGVSFHVSCPVSLFSVVRARPHGDGDTLLGEKARSAAGRALRKIGYRRFFSLDGVSALKPGIGMASSTADIAAAVTAVCLAAGVAPTEAATAALAVGVEPSDGTVFSGIVAFDHKRGRFMRRLGSAPDLKITYVDTGGIVDTVEFNRRKIIYTGAQETAIRAAYEMVAAGLRHGDSRLIGEAATLSARVNQAFLPKPGLEDLIDIAGECGGYGVVVAHSGTVMGVIHDQDADAVAQRVSALGNGMAETVRLINGGCRSWVV